MSAVEIRVDACSEAKPTTSLQTAAEAYEINLKPIQKAADNEEERGLEDGSAKHNGTPPSSQSMKIKCVSCGEVFDSTFTVEDFEFLSKEQQQESGTLHLCPRCGHLGIYRITDYFSPQ